MATKHDVEGLNVIASQKSKERDYWLSKLAGELVKSSFPYDYNQSDGKTGGKDSFEFKISGELFSRLMWISNNSDIRLFVILAAVLNILLGKYSYDKGDDIIVGTSIYKQQVEGEFVNTVIALRNKLHPHMTFKTLLLQVSQALREAAENQNYPIETLLYQLNIPFDHNSFPLFDVAILLENIHDKRYIRHIDQNVIIAFFRTDECIRGQLEYNPSLFKTASIKRYIDHFIYLLDQALGNIEIPISGINLLSEEERQLLLLEFNNTKAGYPQNKTIHGLFAEQVERTPDSAAAVGKEKRIEKSVQLTYRELNHKSHQLAGLLRGRGVKPGTIVGIMVERSLEMIIGILGILKSGGAYLPIDPDYPAERIRYMLEDSNARVLLKGNTVDLKKSEIRISKFETNPNDQNSNDRNEGTPAIVLNFEFVSDFEFCASNLSPSNLAYVIYTSGTTGKPKGVMVEHGNVVRLLFNDKFQFDFNHRDVWTMFHRYCFDFSVWEMFGALLYGGRLVIVPKMAAMDPGEFLDILKKENVTILNQTPSAFYNLIREDTNKEDRDLKVRVVIFGGEALSPGKLKEWHIKYPGTKLINMFGITETTVHVTYKEITDDEIQHNISNIGKPIPTLSTYIMDKNLKLAPVGVPGELCVGGSGVSRGYLGMPELTSEKFISNPYKIEEKLYRSGDLAVFLENGEMKYLGRIDHQVQLRGFRIEPGEIESRLLNLDFVKDAVVLDREDETGHKYLCAYMVLHGDEGKSQEGGIAGSEIKRILARNLPDYMIPSYFIKIDKIPLTPNGKVDRKALPEPTAIEGEYIAPGNEIEEKLCEIWEEVLKLEKVSVNSNFFNIGGDSIKAIRLITRINEEFGTDVKIPDLYTNETIEELADCIDVGFSSENHTAREKIRAEIEDLKQRIFKEHDFGDDIEDIYPLSDIEKGMVFASLMNPETGVYHEQFVYRLVYPGFEPGRFRNALRLLVDKHSILRTCCNVASFDTEVHVVYGHVPVEIEHKDLTSMSNEEQNDYIRGYLQLERKKRFDISSAPLWRMSTFHVGDDNIVITWQFHHVILDGWSNASLMTELNNTYLRLETEPGFVPGYLKSGYKDFVIEQLVEKGDSEILEYWRKELSGYKRLDIFNKESTFEKYTYNHGSSFLEEIKRAVSKYNSSLKTLGFAAYVYMLSMMSYEDDLVVGMVTNNRPACRDGDKILGCFLNSIPVRVKVPCGITWREYVEMIDRKITEVKSREKLSLFEIARAIGESTGEGNPIFDTVFGHIDFYVFQETQLVIDMKGRNSSHNTGENPKEKQVSISGHENTNTMFDFGINTTGGSFALDIWCKRTLKCNIETLTGYFITVLKKIMNSPGEFIGKDAVLSGEEKKRLLDEFNNTKTGYPRDKSIPQLFAEQALERPDAITLTCEDSQLTYRELDEQADRLAGTLRRKGVRPGGIVAMMTERSLEMIVGILGILKAGGAYLPIEPDIPVNRALSMMEDGEVSLLLTTTDAVKGNLFTTWQNLQAADTAPFYTTPRPQILDFDSLPIPDRSLVNYEKYSRYISQAPVKNVITMQGTRGCPYHCAYCHKIWPKRHVIRSAENILEEVNFYYRMGIRRFALLDDIFNLNIKNSSRFFQLILKNRMDVQLFFPSGMRGDILTKDYIDLMVEAGTVDLPLALETASPRLQELIGKKLDIEKLQKNIEYICEKHPQLILSLYTMLGFPTETKEEARMTLDFIKDKKWLHFPYIFVLKIWANTDMAKLAIENGVPRETILESDNLAYQELPDTLPFEKEFVIKAQADFVNEYFLSRERLLHVLPNQMKVLTEDEMVQKYNSYLPVDINSFDDLLQVTGITANELKAADFVKEESMWVPDLNEKIKNAFPREKPEANALRILLLDLSQFFSTESAAIYNVVETPVGLMYLLTCLKKQYGKKVHGKIAKSFIDFDNYRELKALIENFKPGLIGIRVLNYYKEFFHRTVALIRQWGFDAPIISGGPYATSNSAALLQDKNIDLVVIGEGELTFNELIGKVLENDGKLPDEDVLKNIPGIAFIPRQEKKAGTFTREIIMLDAIRDMLSAEPGVPLGYINDSADLAYIAFTSGSTGKPKGVMVEHKNVSRLVKNSNYLTIQPADIILQLSNYAFDGSVFDIFGALLNGAELVIVKKDDLLDVIKLSALIKKENITIFFVTTALFNVLVDTNIECFENIRCVLFGGERVSFEHVKRAFEYMGPNKILHVYGPTETTVYATYHPVIIPDETLNTVPIGKPLANTTVYILDKHRKPVPVGVPGEIFIGGDAVARGYLRRKELTKETFILNPFVENDRWYRTGDLARWLPDGNIEFLGRIDNQLKLRGFRVELGEIESQLLNFEEIKEAVVLAREDRSGDKYLCAYIVLKAVHGNGFSMERAEDFSETRRKLSRNLPDYMIPSYFVELEKMPLNRNGKVDVKSLPDPVIGGQEDYIAPRDEIERKLVDVWADVLNINKEVVGIHANFFELGGHSLKATILISRIHKELNVKIPLVVLFETQTVKGLSGYIRRVGREAFTSIEAAEEKEYYALSPAQKRLYIMQRTDFVSTAYNIHGILYLHKDMDSGKLGRTFRELIRRHGSLRTSFEIVNEVPVQIIHDNVDFKIEYFLSGSAPVDSIASPGDIEKIIENFVRPFDLRKAPLLRIGLISTREDKILLIDMNHIISDGTSLEILSKEFRVLYRGNELPRLRLQYRDYSEWYNREKQQEKIKKQEEYWLNLFSGEIPELDLFMDFPRPKVPDFEGNFIDFKINREDTRGFTGIGLTNDATLFINLVTVLYILLYKYTGQNDIIIGSDISGRTHADLQNIVGMFVNMLPIRNYPEGNKTYLEFLKEVKGNCLKAFENQDMQFDELVEQLGVQRSASRNPLFDIQFMVHNFDISLPHAENKVGIEEKAGDRLKYKNKTSMFDIGLEAMEKGGEILMRASYRTNLFRKDSIERFISHFKDIVSWVVKNPNARIWEIEIVSEEDAKRALKDIKENEMNVLVRETGKNPGHAAVMEADFEF